MRRPSSAGVSRVGSSAELAELAEKKRIGGLAVIVVTLVTPFPGGTMDEQALYTAIAPELEHTDEEHARDIIRIIRAVLLARDREVARELRLHPERHH